MIRRYLFLLAGLLMFSGCVKQKEEQEEKKTYFHKNEFKQGKSFRLIHHMPFGELKEEKEHLHKDGLDYLAINFLREMIKKCEDPEMLRDLRLEYADMLYDLKQFKDASTEYELYVRLYPGSKRAPYADYRSIDAQNKEVLSADCDQVSTEKVIDMAKEYGKKVPWSPGYKDFVKEVEQITHDCLHRLYESEVLRFYFYLNRQQCKAALKRLEYIRERYLKYLPEIEPSVIELDYELCCELKQPDQATKKKGELQEKHPQFKMDSSRRRAYARII